MRKKKNADLGRPAASRVTIISPDGNVKTRAAKKPSPGAVPNAQHAFGTHSKAYRAKVSQRKKTAGANGDWNANRSGMRGR